MNFECQKIGEHSSLFLEANFLCFLECQNLDAKFSHYIISKNSIRNYPKMCLVKVAICVPKAKNIQSNQKKWQAIEK